MSSSSSSNKRRPQTFRSCPGSVGTNAMVMDATLEISYQMETDQPDLSEDDRDLVLSYLRDDILQSLINAHCPKQGERNREREVGSMEYSAGDGGGGLEALSVHAGAPQLHGTCPVTHPDSLSCHVFSNDIMLLFDSRSTSTDLQNKVLDTIEQYMEHNFYINQVNLKLAEIGSPFHVTTFTYQDLHSVSDPTTSMTTEEEVLSSLENVQSTPIAFVGTEEQQQQAVSSGQSSGVDPIMVLLASMAGFLGVMLFFLLWRRFVGFHQESVDKSKSGGSINGTLVTGEETLVSGEDDLTLEKEFAPVIKKTSKTGRNQNHRPYTLSNETLASGDETLFLGEKNTALQKGLVPAIKNSTFKPNNYRFTLREEDTSTSTESSTLQNMIAYVEVDADDLRNDTYSASPPPQTLPPVAEEALHTSAKCTNTRCKACSKAPDNDPNYMCPNYQTPWKTSSRDNGDAVNLRVFEEESAHPMDDIASRNSKSVVPPSRVNLTRNSNNVPNSPPAPPRQVTLSSPPSQVNVPLQVQPPPILTQGGMVAPSATRGTKVSPAYAPRSPGSGGNWTTYGMGLNSLLASSTSDEATAEEDVPVERVVVIKQGMDPPYIQRSLRPAKTVEL